MRISISVSLPSVFLDLDTGALEMEEFQKVDEVALHKAQAAQIVQLVFAEVRATHK